MLDMILVAVTLLTAYNKQWASQVSHTTIVSLTAATSFGGLLLLAASNWPGVAQDALSLIGGVPETPHTAFRIERWRPFIFYPAVYFNLLIIVFLIHATGGLTGSPYTGFLYALVLGTQVFSRYRRQSFLYIVGAAILTAVIVILDAASPANSAIEAPRSLTAFVTIGSFAVAALLAQVTKPGNPATVKVMPIPNSAVVYQDPQGAWRYVMYSRSRVIDPLIPRVSTWYDAKAAVEEQLSFHYQAQAKLPNFVWQRPNSPSSRTVQIEVRAEINSELDMSEA